MFFINQGETDKRKAIDQSKVAVGTVKLTRYRLKKR